MDTNCWLKVRYACLLSKSCFYIDPLETCVKPNMFNIWVKNKCVNPKLTLLGGRGGLDGRNSTPMGCLTGSGAIFTRGLGGGGLTCFHGKKNQNGPRV